MKASAPGKLVLSGAYAVLRGAPALVTAVNRRVLVDTSRSASFETPEVAAGLELFGLSGSKHPWFDAEALREDGRKLGLGSSAAICAASLFALWYDQQEGAAELDWVKAIYPVALRAHRKAQGGGSGIDVAAACFGGTIEVRMDASASETPPLVTPVDLPTDLVIEVWGSAQAAKTSEFVSRVFAHENSQAEFSAVFSRQFDASRLAADALRAGDSHHLLSALRSQVDALYELGQLCDVAIVLPEVWELHRTLDATACFLPSGAGGGDVTLYFGHEPSNEDFRARAVRHGIQLLDLGLAAPGLRIEA